MRPTQDIDSFEGQDEIEIVLNRGQTFSFRAESLFLGDRLTGTTISVSYTHLTLPTIA